MLEHAWGIWRRRKWLAIPVFVVPLTAAASVVAFAPNVYQSMATVLVDRQQIPEVFVRPTVTSELETHLRTISQEILSRSRLDSIIKRFGLYAKLRTVQPDEAVIERMRSDIRLDLTRSDLQRRDAMIVFAISYRGFDPDTVAQVTNMLASSYVEENLKVRERQATGAAEFLKVQLQEARKRLDDQERQVSQFKRRNLGELPQQIETALGIIDRLDAQLRLNIDNQTRLGERREMLAKREAQMPIMPDDRSGGSGDKLGPPPESPGETLARMQRELRQLRIRYTDKHPDVVRVRIAIAELEKELSESPPPAVMATREARTVPRATTNPYLSPLRQAQDEIDGELRALTAEEKRLRASIATNVSRVQNAPKVEQELKELSRDYESTRELYASLSKRYEEAQLAETMEQRQKGEQFRILDPAQRSAGPAAPNRRRLFFVAGVLSLGLAVGAVVLAEALDTSFHSRETLRSFTTVRVIGLPRILLDTDVRRQRWQFCLAAIGTTLVLVLIIGISYYFAHGNDRLVRW
jgi:polysaccharide chain length determinant protein (PEP-CTERM system associated)